MVLRKLEPEGLKAIIVPPETDKEDVDEVHETVAEEVPMDVGHKVGTNEEVMREEGALEVHPEVKEAGEVHPQSNNNYIQPFRPFSS